jgi:hypothetical protein
MKNCVFGVETWVLSLVEFEQKRQKNRDIAGSHILRTCIGRRVLG